MKTIKSYCLFMTIWAVIGAASVVAANADTVTVDDKAYQLVEIDGQLLVSNEWKPTTIEGYTDEYRASEQYQTIKQANESLRKIKESL